MTQHLQALKETVSDNNAGRPVHLLVVDDDELSRSIMGLMLAPHGYELDFARDGAEALEAIKSRAYDLVFLDLVLPDMNGRDVCREVRRWEAGRKHLPIVAVTAYDLPGQPLELAKAGMDDYIFKPYDLRGLTRLIQIYAANDEDDGEAQGTPGSTGPLINYPVLDIAGSLEDFANDAESYRELLRDFMGSLPDRLNRMVQAQAAADADRLGRECHSLKGISAGLGAMRLSKAASRVNKALKNGQAQVSSVNLHQIESAVQEFQAEAIAYLSS